MRPVRDASVLADAVDEAREAAVAEAAADLPDGPAAVGAHLESVAEDDGAVTHYFAAEQGGYRGWRWAVTLAAASPEDPVTVSEVVLLPGPEALVAPAWVPWERPDPARRPRRRRPPARARGRPAARARLRRLRRPRGRGRRARDRAGPRAGAVARRPRARRRALAGRSARPRLRHGARRPRHVRHLRVLPAARGLAARRVRRVRQRVRARRRRGRRGRLRLRGALRRARRGCRARSRSPSWSTTTASTWSPRNSQGVGGRPLRHRGAARGGPRRVGGSPTRFREDANAEEDLRLGGYADTWFVELAQNAADAAGVARTAADHARRATAAAGTRPAAVRRCGAGAGRDAAGRRQRSRPRTGRRRGSALRRRAGAHSGGGPGTGGQGGGRRCGAGARRRWRGRRAARWRRAGELRVANTGAPLTAAGVAALASLRASAKRDDAGAVGRFGVGFAAVLAVSAEPRVVSTSGAVAFSADRTAAAVADLPGPAAELARRDAPPVLRLVWPSAEHAAGRVRRPRSGCRCAPAPTAPRCSPTPVPPHPTCCSPCPPSSRSTSTGRSCGVRSGTASVTIGPQRWRLARRAGVLEGPTPPSSSATGGTGR